MQRARVRGTYSTALTKLLLDQGFEIVQPSVVIKERFGLNDTDTGLPPDLDITDRLDKQGVYVVGETISLDALVGVLQSSLDDVIVRRRAESHGIDYRQPTSDSTVLQSVNKDTGCTRSDSELDSVDIEFPAISKKNLDALRGLVTPTIDGHHHFKACGGKISYLLEMAEKMLEKDAPRNEVEKLFVESVMAEYPTVDSRIDIEHVKIDGRLFHLNNARIVDFDEKEGSLRLLRTFKKSGTYDGLRMRKDPNDYALTEMRIGDWSFRTKYFSSDGRYKGTYINLNTPVELYPDKIRYVDLEVDVCLWPDGKMEKLDLDKLEGKIYGGYVSEKLGDIVKTKLEEITDLIRLEPWRYKGPN